VIGDRIEEALVRLGDRSGYKAVVIELGTQCLGVYTGEARGEEGSNMLGFARFRLGDDAPSNLVELVRQSATPQSALDAAKQVFESAGLQVAVCKDVPGPDHRPLIRPYYNAALRRLDEGLATASDMDTTLKLGLGYPEGPITLLERSGLHHHFDVTEALFEAYGDPRMRRTPGARGEATARLQRPRPLHGPSASAMRPMTDRRPLAGIRVLDFSTLLPGPLATLLLAEAGAEVIKIERPGRGDEMRSYVPKFGTDSVNFAMLNRGKRSIAIDLKAAGAVDRLRPLLQSADVVVEQFRPGVMDRLGLGYEQLKAINPRIVYCAITGWDRAARRPTPLRTISTMSPSPACSVSPRCGWCARGAGQRWSPIIAGGTYPAVINILLALR